MGKAIMIFFASVIALFFMLTGSFAGDILRVNIHTKGDIIGAKVRSIQGEQLGEISSLIFDKDTGNITHVIISHGDIMINGKKQTPVPLNALRFTGEKNACVNMAEAGLNFSPTFEKTDVVQNNGLSLDQ